MTTPCIVLGNEKGGSGKSTTAMHVAIALIYAGYKVGTLDLDARQGTLSHYLRNRFEYVKQCGQNFPGPSHMAIEPGTQDEDNFFTMALTEMSGHCDVIVVDTPGTNSHLGRMALSHADLLLTPVNDSLIDLDVLARIDPNTLTVLGPSHYCKTVSEKRAMKNFAWIVMRNRLTHINSRNKEIMGELLEQMAKDFDFMVANGFGERVIYKDMFLNGLTLLDLKNDPNTQLSMSVIAARREINDLLSKITSIIELPTLQKESA